MKTETKTALLTCGYKVALVGGMHSGFLRLRLNNICRAAGAVFVVHLHCQSFNATHMNRVLSQFFRLTLSGDHGFCHL